MNMSKMLETSRNSLTAYQQAMSITSHNIANANNPKFSRQRVNFSAETAERIQNFSIGSGMKIDDILRVKNQVTDNQLRSYTQSNSYADKQSSILGQLETVLNEPGETGISSLLGEFYGSWDKLSVQPNSASLRNNVIASAQKFSAKLQGVYESFNRIKPDVKAEADTAVQQLNGYLKQIKDLNTQIFSSKVQGGTPNDLLDTRDNLIDEISKIANVTVNVDKDGMASVSVSGALAVDRFSYSQYKVSVEGDKMVIRTEDGNDPINVTGGTLGALNHIYSSVVPEYLNKLDAFARRVMDGVNAAHKTGYTGHTPPQTGVDFFTGYTGGKLNINPDIIDNTQWIAASSNGQNADNKTALALAGLAESLNAAGQTPAEEYSSFVTGLGTVRQLQQQEADSSGMVLQQLENERSSYSGVSVDEEMVNLMKYQQSYNAAARLIKTANELFDALLQVV